MTSMYDREAFADLLKFFPVESQSKVQLRVQECERLFVCDRHFDLIDEMKALLEFIRSVEDELATAHVAVDIGVGDDRCGAPPAVMSATTSASEEQASGGKDSSNNGILQPTSLSAGLLAAFLEGTSMFTTAQEKVRASQSLSDDIKDHTSWTPTTSIDENGYGTYYRAEAGKSAHSFKVIGEVQESILHVVSVIMELDLYTEWFPFCCEAEMQGELTRFHKSSRFVVQVPWPMNDREVFLVGYGVDDLTNRKRVVITSRSIQDDEELHPNIRRPSVGKKCTRISVEVGGFLLEALSPNSCRVSFIMNVDPQIPHVPTWLVNWVSGKMIWVLLHQMDKAAKRAGKKKSKYTERRHKRPDIYEHLQERAAEVYAKHFPGEPVPPLDRD